MSSKLVVIAFCAAALAQSVLNIAPPPVQSTVEAAE